MAQGTGTPGSMTPTQAALLRMTYGAQAAQVIYVAAKLGLADLLQDDLLSGAELAAAVGADAAILRRILRALVSLGICTESAGDRFGLAEMALTTQVASK